VRTAAPAKGQTVVLRVTVSGPTVKVTRVDGPDRTISVRDTRYRGGYVFLGRDASAGHQGPGVSFSGVTVGR
jgi:hypothetical protein